LLFAHFSTLLPLDSPDNAKHLTTLLETISNVPSDGTPMKCRILSNLFNTLPRSSPWRIAVCNTLLNIATSEDEFHILQLSKSDVQTWLTEWEIPPEEKTAFLKRIIDAQNNSGQPIRAYEYALLYAKSLPSGSTESVTAALDLITTALRLPTIFDFDSLLKLDSIIAQKDHELFSLLQVFLNDGLNEFLSWESSHPGAIEKYGLDKTELERKIRLLTLSSLGFKHVGQDLTYSKIAQVLQVDISAVEKWVIDVIRAGLLSGKLSQKAQTLHVAQSTARTFEKEQWEILEKRLLAWKGGLANVLDVIANARRLGGVTHVSAETQTV